MDEERTEQASPRKRLQARQRGEGPRSKELTDAFNLLAGLLALWYSISFSLTQTSNLFIDTLTSMSVAPWHSTDAPRLFVYIVVRSLILVAPVMGLVLFVTTLVNVAQSGFVLSGAKLEPKLDKLDPVKGMQRIFSMKGTVETLKSILKMIVVGIIVYSFLKARWIELVTSPMLPPTSLFQLFGKLAFDLGLRLVAFLLLLALVDYFYQRYEFEKSIRMSKHEVKEEMKQTEGDPLVRQRLRQRARQIALTRMLSEVPEADVVIANPTHYAVALKYVPEVGAPMVVARGVNAVALRIREVAEAAGVPVEENPELAQTLWRELEVGEQVPFELYEVIAEILARVYAEQGRQVA